MFARLPMRLLAATSICSLICAVAAAAPPKPEPTPEPRTGRPLPATAANHADLSTFTKLLKASGLVETLSGETEYTIFAPNNAAFDKLGEHAVADLMKPENKTKLQNILKHHVINGRHVAAQVGAMKTVKCLNGADLKVAVDKEGGVTIDNAKVSQTDILASNGAIHVIDVVLKMPES